jgi:ribonuclease HII
LVAAAVILTADFRSEDGPLKLRDSKKMTKKQREIAAEFIRNEALAIGIGWVWPEAIDRGGITQAVKSAMTEAIQMINIDYDEVIIDGNINYLADVAMFRGPSSDGKIRAVVKADDRVLSVSAASIIAKVARDRYMAGQSELYPGYGFEQHVGYGTTLHINALRQLGVTEIHRKSYKPVRALIELS